MIMKKITRSIIVLTALLLVWAAPVLAAMDPSDLTFKSNLVENGGILTDTDNPITVPAAGITTSETLPAKYDLRDVDGKNDIAPVKFQNPWGSCWAFGTISSVESNAMVKGATGVNLSEKALAWYDRTLQGAAGTKESMKEGTYVATGTGLADSNTYRGGRIYDSIGQLSTWNGASTTEQVPYKNASGAFKTIHITADKTADYYLPDGTWGLDDSHLRDDTYHVEKVQLLSTDPGQASEVKQAIMDNGAIYLSFNAPQEAPYYNSATSAVYTDTEMAADHAVSIIGWDDSYSRTNFTEGHQPANDGAWIVKNSWSGAWADGGYFYLSYEDKTIYEMASVSVDYPANNVNGQFKYTHNYDYDYLGTKSHATNNVDLKIAIKAMQSKQSMKAANIFTADGDQTLEAVSTFGLMDPNSTVETQIYKVTDGENPESGTLVASQTDTVNGVQYSTLPLKTPVALKKGEKFSVVQTQKTPDGDCWLPVEYGVKDGQTVTVYGEDGTTVTNNYVINNKATCASGQSFVYGIGESGETDSWHDMGDSNFTGKFMTFPYTTTSTDGSTTKTVSTVAYPGNVMIKAFTTDTPKVTYEVHGRNYGWDQGWVFDGTTAGTTGRALRIEALQAKIVDENGNSIPGLGITYQAHVQNIGWMDWESDGTTAGTTGRGLQMEAIRMKLTGSEADQFTLTYRVHVQNQGWTDWVAADQEAGTTGKALRAEAVEINIVRN